MVDLFLFYISSCICHCYAPRKISEEHKVGALYVCPSVIPSSFLSSVIPSHFFLVWAVIRLWLKNFQNYLAEIFVSESSLSHSWITLVVPRSRSKLEFLPKFVSYHFYLAMFFSRDKAASGSIHRSHRYSCF